MFIMLELSNHEFESSKNIVLLSFCPWTKIARWHGTRVASDILQFWIGNVVLHQKWVKFLSENPQNFKNELICKYKEASTKTYLKSRDLTFTSFFSLLDQVQSNTLFHLTRYTSSSMLQLRSFCKRLLNQTLRCGYLPNHYFNSRNLTFRVFFCLLDEVLSNTLFHLTRYERFIHRDQEFIREG